MIDRDFSRDNPALAFDKSLMNQNDQCRFFLVYPIDLEDLGLVELKEKFSLHFSNTFTLLRQIPGGLEIECPLHCGLQLNMLLRTPTRILLRLCEFKCRDAPKLYQKVSKFNWAPWLIGQTPEVESASTNSRLFDSRKIKKAIQDGVLQYYRHQPVKKKYLDHLAKTDPGNLPKIYFRCVDDLCTLSLDTTGERLHLRNEKTLTALAPIRESLAALLLLELQSHLPKDQYTLIDPMCGSGTFLLEAHDFHSVTQTRNFSYLHMPVVLEEKSFIKTIDDTKGEPFFSHLMGFEINPDVIRQAMKNCETKNIVIKRSDLFDETITRISPSAVIINPPYGIRVGERGTKEDEINLDYYKKIVLTIKKKFTPKLLGIIIPKDFLLKSTQDFKIISCRPFKNGGLDVIFYVISF